MIVIFRRELASQKATSPKMTPKKCNRGSGSIEIARRMQITILRLILWSADPLVLGVVSLRMDRLRFGEVFDRKNLRAYHRILGVRITVSDRTLLQC